MKVDYIIVGCGLAGIAFAEQLKKNQKTFMVFDDGSQQSSTVAGGLYNPVILKRFTPVWKSKEQLEIALPFYKQIEEDLNISIDYKTPVLRLFHSIEEQNNWFAASDKENLKQWMSAKIINNKNPFIKADFGFGEVLHTGRIKTSILLNYYKKDLEDKNQFTTETFNYDDLVFEGVTISYKNISAKNIVFSEGFGLKKNPFFKDLPLTGTKGELLIIEAPDLNLNAVLKSNAFLIPLGNSKYIVGATYNWTDKTNQTTVAAKNEIKEKLDKFITCKYQIINQIAAIRPTVKDRRPLVGVHKQYSNVFVLNGLGTRGVMIAPYIAQKLYNFIEKKVALDVEIDIKRFENC